MSRPAANTSVFHAIADPTRRALLDLVSLRERGVGELAGRFEMSLPAVSQHLRVLLNAGLVQERRVGRRKFFRFEPGPLDEVAEWVWRRDERFWKGKLEKLGVAVDDGAGTKRRRPR